MADPVGKCNDNNTLPFEDEFSVKLEECQDEDFIDDKIHISETAVSIGNPEMQEHSLPDKIKQEDILTTLENIKTELSLPEVQYDLIHDNVKIEEDINADDIKIELNNGLLYCEDCHTYCEDYCAKCGMLVHILNRTATFNTDNRSQQELPHDDILEIHNYFGELRIFALKIIPVGVKFGPFTGLSETECPWKIKGGKFMVNEDKAKYLNWMQYINPAKNISEHNLHVLQCKENLYFQSTRLIQEGDELLVYFGEKYEDSLNRNVEMEFVPTKEHIFKDTFACTFCCLGFSSKSYLAKHKAICFAIAAGGFSIEELTQCPCCGIHFGTNEYFRHHMAHCCKINDSDELVEAQNESDTDKESTLLNNENVNRNAIQEGKEEEHAQNKRKRITRKSWRTEEKRITEAYFKQHIKTKQAPKKNEVLQLIHRYPSVFKNRKWECIKAYIYNVYSERIMKTT